MSKRLIKAANELNVATSTLVEYLSSKGFEVENKPTAKLTPDMEKTVREAFAKALQNKKKADQLKFNTRPTAIPPPPPPPPPEPIGSKTIPHSPPTVNPGLKVIGTIDLDAAKRSIEQKKAPPQNPPSLRGLKTMGKIDIKKPDRNKRLIKIASECNISTLTIISYLSTFGIEVENKPTAKIDSSGQAIIYKKYNKLLYDELGVEAQTRPLTPEEAAEEKIEEQLSHKSDTINLSGLGLEKFPERLKNISSVTTINLSNNRIGVIPNWASKKSDLTELNLSNNEIKTADFSATYFSELTTINLSKNLLPHAPTGLSSLHRLSNLNISDNEIKTVETSDFSTSSIATLNLSLNDITDISISHLPPDLTVLDITSNKIEHFNEAILAHRKLVDIRLFGNKIENVPVVIWDKKENRLESLKDYFSSIQHNGNTYQLFEAKLVLVGNGGVGKSSLLHTLIESDLNIKNLTSTEGIDIVKWPLDVKNVSNDEIDTDTVDLNIWDFGGQEIYRSTHQFFLTKSSIYIFVWDARVEEDYISFSYWLSIIKILSSGSPTIVVMNKADEREKQIDEISLSIRFDNIVTYHKVSCTTKQGIKDLIEIIKSCISKLDHIGNRWSKKRVHLKKLIEGLDQDTQTYDDFEDLCIKMGLSIEEVSHFAEQLHDLGTIIHYKDNEILQDIVILDPEWATDGVYKVLDDKNAKEKKGKLSYEDFKEVWRKSKRHRGEYTTLLALMKEFSLCFYSETNKVYIVPHLLSAKKPDYLKLQEANTYEITYNYDFLPAGIIESFICDNHNIIKNDLYWKYGACLEPSKKCRAEVITNPLDLSNKIVIRVSSVLREEKNKALAIIENSLSKIHERFPDLKFRKSIRCNCTGKSRCHFNLDMIDDFERFNIRKIRCKEKDNEYRLVPIDFIGGANLDNDIISTTQQLLSIDNIREALEKLKAFVLVNNNGNSDQYIDQIVAFQSELNRIEDLFAAGSSKDGQRSLQRNRLINRVQSLIRKIERLEN